MQAKNKVKQDRLDQQKQSQERGHDAVASLPEIHTFLKGICQLRLRKCSSKRMWSGERSELNRWLPTLGLAGVAWVGCSRASGWTRNWRPGSEF